MVHRSAKLLPLCGLAFLQARHSLASLQAFVSTGHSSSALISSRGFAESLPSVLRSRGGGVRSLASASIVEEQQSRPRRSVLFVPPRLDRAVSVAATCDADTLIFDLEDAVAPVHKDEARLKLMKSIQEGEFGTKEVGVRCNGLGTEWVEEDIKAIAGMDVHACVIPKVESRLEIEEARKMFVKHGAPSTMEIWAMVETPLGVLQAQDIAAASEGAAAHPLRALVVGSSDLTKELGGQHTPSRHPLVPSFHLVLLAARGRGLVAIDGVHFSLDDAAEFAAHCRQGREMGFDGKSLLHPKQIATCNDIFARPDPSASPGVDLDTYCTEWAYQVDTWE